MELLNLLYTFFIGPLALFFEVTYFVAYRSLDNPAAAIVFLSLAMNIMVLPLYRRADAMQEAERDRALAMKPWTDHIKKTFSGDERFMMQQTYNRQMGYKQTDVFRGSVSLLLEIPFFIAAYHFLSNLEVLRGTPLGPIADLGAPDALISIGGATINFLPILMTVINVVSAAIYLKGFPTSSKVQTYGIAAIFLILLYNSPAGLVFYWTLNNIFSLCKNLFYKLKDPGKVLAIMLSVLGFLGLAFVAVEHIRLTAPRVAIIALFFIVMEAPLLRRLVHTDKLSRFSIPEASKSDDRTFFFGCLFLAALMGVLIPITIIHNSPAEFVDVAAYRSPLWYVARSLALSLGTFVLWFGVFYQLATPKGKTIFGALVFIGAGTAIVNYLFFGTDFGNLSSFLKYDSTPGITVNGVLVNAGVLVAVGAVLLFVYLKWKAIPRVAYVSLAVAILAVGIYSAVGIEDELAPVRESALAAEQAAGEPGSADAPKYVLSKTGKNVIVVMLDRAIPGFVPFMVHEKPELKEMLSGFTVYSNAVSFGADTNSGAPALYGGSDYRPKQMNERTDTTLQDKHNEALHVMPRLFSEAGYTSTLFDPTYAGYKWNPDVSVFDDLSNTKAYSTLEAQFGEGFWETPEGRERIDSELSRNFFCYSIAKTSPLALFNFLYQYGGYNSTEPIVQFYRDPSVAIGIDLKFAEPYSVLDSLPEIATISDEVPGAFFLMANDATHANCILQEPAYEPAQYVDNREYDQEHAIRYDDEGNALPFLTDDIDPSLRLSHYEADMAAMLKVGEWCEYLKEQGVYDNTRIIIVSDHSWPFLIDDKLYLTVDDNDNEDTITFDSRYFTCLLMVKDFDSKGFTYDDRFMTNADVPVLAFEGIVEDPVNPYTGNPIDSSYKEEPEQLLLDTAWRLGEHTGPGFNPGRWFSVKDDPSKADNWEYLGYY